MKVVAFLPAKGTSERIASKNMKLLNGKPLFLHTLEKLVSCDFIDEVYLDSESDEILNYASHLNYIPLKRKAELATNRTDGHQLFYNEVSQVKADIYVQILGTSPFISKSTIKKGIDILINDESYDSVVLMKKDKQYLWKDGNPVYDKFNIPNSNTLPDTIIESMGMYIIRSETAHSKRMRFGDRVYMLYADPIETIDVNYPEEFELADLIMKGIQAKENSKFRILSKFFNSAVFSDILFEYGLNNVISGMTLNLKDKKIMGRANTLKIRRLLEGEDYREIYKGLETYSKMSQGEIIVVDNEVGDRAYFGELNANLAIRSGAVGTIVNGVTRDIEAVTQLDYPVFARGYCCSDVKGVATVEAHQVPVTIDGVIIYPGDLIFADICGIVVVPKMLEEKVIERAIQVISSEKSILNRVLKDEEAIEIYHKEGEF